MAGASDVESGRYSSRIDRLSTAALIDAVARINSHQLADRIEVDWAEIVNEWSERSRFSQACVKVDFVDQAGLDQRSTLDVDVQSVGTLLDRSSAGESALAGLPPGRRDVEARSSLANPSPLLPPPRS